MILGGARVLREVRRHPAARGGHQRGVAVRGVPRVRGALQPAQVRLPLARRGEQGSSRRRFSLDTFQCSAVSLRPASTWLVQ